MSTDSSVISYVIRYNDLVGVQRQGITDDYFVDEFKTVWKYLTKTRRDHDTLPSKATLLARFPDLDLPRVRESEIPMLLQQLRERKKFTDLLKLIHATADQLTDYDRAAPTIQWLQGQLNTLAFSTSEGNHIIDLFDAATAKEMLKEHKERGSEKSGIKTGLVTLDKATGGLHKQQMVTVIARTGQMKTWVNLLFVKSAVMQGKKVLLYPLEMSAYETAARLYTLFSSDMLGHKKAIKNFDLMHGGVPKKKLVQFMNSLEDRFAGQLYMADVGRLADPYTVERIEAEVEAYGPDMFWVDYITLVQPPQRGRNDSEVSGIRSLSRGIKNVAARRNVVGGASAQVNREGIRAGAGIVPRLEHIYNGDSIGHDSNAVISMARKDKNLWYGLVKHRNGPETDAIKLTEDVNRGILQEAN